MTRFALLAASLLAFPALAAELPRPVGTDPHVQSIGYDPDAVVALKGQLGFQTMIEFQADERIENVAIGDATAWQVTPNKRADILFVKPIQAGGPTNLTIVTDKRRYMFALSIAPIKSTGDRVPWVLRFRLPAPPVAPKTALAASAPAYKNADYTVTGTAEVMPLAVYDDGARTYFAWADQAAIPAIFAVNPDGSESVTNPAIRDGRSVVEQVAGAFVLRSGASKAIVTSTPGIQRRMTKGGKP